jgi:hypothetical protein
VTLVALLLLVGCSDEQESAPSPPPPAPPCGPGEQTLDDGSCYRAGLAPGHCAAGFELNGLGECDPLLPVQPCPPGQMAVPGDSVCRELAPCGDPPWGDIPIEPGAVFVDANYPNSDSDGSEGRPWQAIQQAVTAAVPGALIAVAEGIYSENVRVDRTVRIWGRCPSLVDVRGPSPSDAIFDIRGSAVAGTELRQLGLAGGQSGVVIAGSADVVLDKLWIHDTGSFGVDAVGLSGPVPVTVSNSLIEGVSSLGLLFGGVDALVDACVVRDVLPRQSDQGFGFGVSAQPSVTTGAGANVTLRGSVVARAREHGVYVFGSVATVEATVVRDTQPHAGTLNFGRGVNVQDDFMTGVRASAIISGSVIERSHDIGVFVAGADVTIDTTVIRDSLPRSSDGLGGRGLNVQVDTDTNSPTSVVLTNSVLARNQGIGAFIAEAAASFDNVAVVDTLPLADLDNAGAGVLVQRRPLDAVQPNFERYDGQLTLISSWIAGNGRFGVLGIDAELIVDRTRITATATTLDVFGDGLVVSILYDDARGQLSNVLIDDNGRAGVASFGATVTLQDSALKCNPLDLTAGEEAVATVFEDRGGNECGCEQAAECRLVTTSVAPPQPVDSE